jgi:hypothetical protein
MEKCKECGKDFKDFKGLNVHMKKMHSNVKIDTKRVEIAASGKELEEWKKGAEQHNFPNLSAYVRFMMRESVGEAEQVRKAELEKQFNEKTEKIENEKKKVEKELEAMKNFFIQNVTAKARKELKRYEKDPTIDMLKRSKDFGKDLERMEEQFVGDRLLEEEWDSLTLGQQADARKLMNKMPLVAAIKKVNKKCSKDFELFFKKELMGHGY